MTKTELLGKVDSEIRPKLYFYLPNITFLLSHAAFFYFVKKIQPPLLHCPREIVRDVLKDF